MVTTVTVDSLLASNGVTYVSFCKIDAEAHEAVVLRGARKALEEGRIQHLAIEGSITSSETVAEFKVLVEKYGYTMRMDFDASSMMAMKAAECENTCQKPGEFVSNAAEFDGLMDCLEDASCTTIDAHFKRA